MSPQAGSTAAIGTAAEGVWISTSARKGLFFVDGQNRFVGYLEGTPANATNTFEGRWEFTGSSWSFTADSMLGLEHAVRIAMPLEGTGTLTAHSSFTGDFGALKSLIDTMKYEYSPGNALAVAPGDLAGTWSSPDRTLTIAPDGTVSGVITNSTIGSCAVKGKIVQVYPGTAKNEFDLTLSGAATANQWCDMTGRGEQTGKAAITFTNTSQTAVPFYRRSLTIFGAVIGGWYEGELLKN